VKSPLKLPSSRTFPGRKNGRNDRIMSGCMTSKSKPYTYLWSLVSRILRVVVALGGHRQLTGRGSGSSWAGRRFGVAVGEAELLVEPPGGPSAVATSSVSVAAPDPRARSMQSATSAAATPCPRSSETTLTLLMNASGAPG
jgi:hypothetical protein